MISASSSSSTSSVLAMSVLSMSMLASLALSTIKSEGVSVLLEISLIILFMAANHLESSDPLLEADVSITVNVKSVLKVHDILWIWWLAAAHH